MKTTSKMVIQRIEIECSSKDIPIPSQVELKKMMVRRTFEHLVRLRWRILAYLYPQKFSKATTKIHTDSNPAGFRKRWSAML